MPVAPKPNPCQNPHHTSVRSGVGLFFRRKPDGTIALAAARDMAESARTLTLIGRRSLHAGEYGTALEHFKLALGADPTSPHIRYLAGDAFLHLGRYGEALKEFNTVIALQQDHLPALFGRALTLSAMGRHAEAADAYDSVLDVEPLHESALCEKAAMLLLLERYDEAKQTLETLLRVYPRTYRGHNNLHAALFELGDLAGAEVHLRLAHECILEVLKKNPGNRELIANLDVIREEMEELGVSV